jgi:hypothetical protein
MSDELLVTLSLRFPLLDRQALAAQIAPVMQAAVAAGGISTHVTVQTYNEEDE